MKETFGDYFIYKGIIFRIFTNYHPKDCYIGQPLYQVLSDNSIQKIKGEVQVINRNVVDHYLPARLFDVNDSDISYIIEQLKQLGVQNINLTGSNLLTTYGYKTIHTGSDIDIVIKGKKNTEILWKNLSSLYDQNFKNYGSLAGDLLTRRNTVSKINTDLHTMTAFEVNKPIGKIKDKHVNITPTYYIEDCKLSVEGKKVTDLGFISTLIKITDCKFADTIPGYYSIQAKYQDKEISTLRSNAFFFMLGGPGICGKHFKVKGRLLLEETDNENQYVLDLDSKWGIANLEMILLD